MAEIYLDPTDNIYRGVGDLAYLNGQIRIAFIRGNEYLEKSDGIPLDGKILTGICVIAGGDTIREVARKSVSIQNLVLTIYFIQSHSNSLVSHLNYLT